MNKSLDKQPLIIKSVKPKQIKCRAHTLFQDPKSIKLNFVEITYEKEGEKKISFSINGELLGCGAYHIFTGDSEKNTIFIYDSCGNKTATIDSKLVIAIVYFDDDNIVFEMNDGKFQKYSVTGELIDGDYNFNEINSI